MASRTAVTEKASGSEEDKGVEELVRKMVIEEMKGQKKVFVEGRKVVDEACRRLKEEREASRDTDVKSISEAYLEGKEAVIERDVEVALTAFFSTRGKKLNQEHEELKSGMENLKFVSDDNLRRLNILERHFNLWNPDKLAVERSAEQYPKGDETVNDAEKEKNGEVGDEHVEDEMVNAGGVNDDTDHDNKEDSDEKLKEGRNEKGQPLEEEEDGGSDVEEDEIADDEEEQEEVDAGSDVEEDDEGEDE